MGSDSTAVATEITDRTPCGHLVPDKVRAAKAVAARSADIAAVKNLP